MRLWRIGLFVVGMGLLVSLNVGSRLQSTYGSPGADGFVNIVALVLIVAGLFMVFRGRKRTGSE